MIWVSRARSRAGVSAAARRRVVRGFVGMRGLKLTAQRWGRNPFSARTKSSVASTWGA